MKRAYSEIKDFIFKDSLSPLKPGDVVILRLHGGNTITYIVNTLMSATLWDNRCRGCAFAGKGVTCPTVSRLVIDIKHRGRRVGAGTRKILRRVLCQANAYSLPRIIFKSVDTILEDL